MDVKRVGILSFILVFLVLAPVVSAANVTTSSSTLREVTDLAYPVELFYAIFLVGVLCLVLDVLFISSRTGVPASAMIVVSAIGFMTFLIAAYMAPFAAKIVIVATETDVRSVSNYMFSPPVTYFCLGLATICFLFVILGVLRYFELLAQNQKRLSNPENQFDMYMRGEYE